MLVGGKSRSKPLSVVASERISGSDGCASRLAAGKIHQPKSWFQLLFTSDGSQFTTGAAANPTLTIVALAIRQADYIADQIAKQNI